MADKSARQASKGKDEPQMNPPPLRYGATGYRFTQITEEET
jgi:hypothetical protein